MSETVEAFTDRAAKWIEANLAADGEPEADGNELRRKMFDAGFAGIAFPEEYGGAELTLQHHKAFYDTAHPLGRQTPGNLMVSVGTLEPTLLDHGSHEAKLQFLPPLLRADTEWIQLLSEPRGGSDMAGSTTRLTRDGDSYVLNGAKRWSSGAHRSDFGLCLYRSDWDVPKHRGLSMIAVPLKYTPGVSIDQTRRAAGLLGDFCQEFFDDVVLPAGNVIGKKTGAGAWPRLCCFTSATRSGTSDTAISGRGSEVLAGRPSAPLVLPLNSRHMPPGMVGSVRSGPRSPMLSSSRSWVPSLQPES